MIMQRKTCQPRQFILLKSRATRHSSLAYLLTIRQKCKIAILTPSEYNDILDFLPLADLTRFYEALYSN
jgi:hypothetical protein